MNGRRSVTVPMFAQYGVWPACASPVQCFVCRAEGAVSAVSDVTLCCQSRRPPTHVNTERSLHQKNILSQHPLLSAHQPSGRDPVQEQEILGAWEREQSEPVRGSRTRKPRTRLF